MDDDQVNLDEIADSKQRREAARLAATDGSAVPAAVASKPAAPDSEATPMQWVKHVTKWLGTRSTLMQTRRVPVPGKKPAGH